MPPDMHGLPRRRRDAAATRAAILETARMRFTREGYERVGVRDIATGVGVDAALVIRYFGSKEQLFAAAVAGQFGLGDLLTGDRATLGERLARLVVQKDDQAGAHDPLLALLRSAANEQAAALLRAALDEEFIRPLARWLGGEAAMLRAGLVAAYLMGLAVTRTVIRSEPLATGEVEALVTLVAPALQAYIDGLPV